MRVHRFAGLLLAIFTLASALTPALETNAEAPRATPADDREPDDLTKDQCVDVNGLGQELRRVGKLSAAREQLRACSSPACPDLVREDCTTRLNELEQAQPTLVLFVRNTSGSDLRDVIVSVDGAFLTDLLDGSAVPVDIGERTLTFESPGHEPATRTILVRVGEKLRPVEITLRPRAPARPAAQATADGAAGGPRGGADHVGMGTAKLTGVIAGGVGVTLLASGAAFGVLASTRWQDARRACPTHMGCSPDAIQVRDSAADFARLANVGFIAGGVLTALGVTLFVTAPSMHESSVALSVTPRGLGMTGRY